MPEPMRRDDSRDFLALQIAILTVSDTRAPETDRSGRLLVERLQTAGHRLHAHRIVPDDIYEIRALVAGWCADEEVLVVITTGGTGITGRDRTPEAVRPLFDRELDGFGELFRLISYEEIGSSTIQSRALAGVSNRTLIFCLPGSPDACVTAWDAIIQHQLDYRTRPCNLAE
ncbi:MAG: molybdenum cofactor biosynthesis protein B, partial [Gammaproteobacteria bacterium]